MVLKITPLARDEADAESARIKQKQEKRLITTLASLAICALEVIFWKNHDWTVWNFGMIPKALSYCIIGLLGIPWLIVFFALFRLDAAFTRWLNDAMNRSFKKD